MNSTYEHDASLSQLPHQARDLYLQAYEEALADYHNSAFANQRAWTAVGRAGFQQNKQTGAWEREK